MKRIILIITVCFLLLSSCGGESELEAAERHLHNAQQAAQDAQDSYESLKNSIDEYNSLLDALNGN